MYSISNAKFISALKAFKARGGIQWTNDLNILLDGTTLDWFVIEKPNASKIAEVQKHVQSGKSLVIEDNGVTGHKTKNQHATQFSGCYIVFGNEARYLSNNIRE